MKLTTLAFVAVTAAVEPAPSSCPEDYCEKLATETETRLKPLCIGRKIASITNKENVAIKDLKVGHVRKWECVD